jgi:hypothetical protein
MGILFGFVKMSVRGCMGDRALKGFGNYPHSPLIIVKQRFFCDFIGEIRDFLFL